MGDAGETYRQWLHLRLGHALVDDLLSPDQAVVWHELCRELRLADAATPDEAPEDALAGLGATLETCLKGHVEASLSPLWAVGSTRAGLCTLVQELLLGLCDGAARSVLADALPLPLVLCGRSVRGPIGMLGMDVRWDSRDGAAAAIDRWWALAERDVRRCVQRDFSVAPLREAARALVIVSGLDELPAHSRETAARWVAELCAAGRPVLVTTQDAEVPELEGLHARGVLRRVFVQPLARAAVDRFLTRWARLPDDFVDARARASGSWSAAIDGRLDRLALARRPATLAMQAVLLGRTGAAADSYPELQRGLLASLDRSRPAHRLMMARMVGDRDSPLAAEERAAWLATLVAAAAVHDQPELGDALGRDPALAGPGGELLRRAAAAWAEGECPIEHVEEDMAQECSDHDPHHDGAMARLLALGRRAGWWRQEHAFVLRRGLPARERLFDVCAAEIRPRPIFVALAELQDVWGAYALPLLRAAPLGYLLAEGGAACPVASAALFAAGPPAEVRPARDLFHRGVLLELALVSLAADDDALQADALELVLRRGVDLGGALDRAVLAELGEAWPAGSRAPVGFGERIAYIDAALELASRLTPDGAPGLVADLEEARRQVVNEGEQGSRLRRLAAFVVVILLYAIDRRLVPQRRELQRGEIRALMGTLERPEAVAAAFSEDRRTQVLADWAWVTEQAWAPHRVAELLLLHMQESVSLAAEDVLPRCHRWLRGFLAARG